MNDTADRDTEDASPGGQEWGADELAGLTIDALSCAAGYRLLFKDLSFSISAGRWIKLTGPNGSGKTTLLRAIAGLVRPVSGSVCWRGQRREVGDPDWHAQMLYQGHSAGWKDGLGARDNLSLQRSLDYGIPSVLDSDPNLLDALLERCGLAGRGALPYVRLSAGQRRRLSLARLAGSQHLLWLLDEPSTALDAQGQALFEKILSEHLLRGGCAVIATHLPVECGRIPIEIDLGAHAGTAPREAP